MKVVLFLQRIRTPLKNFALAALYYSGALWLLAAARLGHRTIVLTYHRVLPAERQTDSFSSRGILVTPETFDRQMRFLKRHFKPLTASEFVLRLRSGMPMPRRSCLVTFDDGWYDMLVFALPVLRRHQVPAVLFVAADYVGTGRCFWQERLARRLHELRVQPETQRILAEVSGFGDISSTDLASRESIRGLVTRLKLFEPGEIEALLLRLDQLAGARLSVGEDRFLDWDEARALAKCGLVAIGSHAMTHRPLTRIPAVEAESELRQSRAVLKAQLGTDAAALAYPNGDATPDIAAIAEATGFSVAFTTARGHVCAGDPPYLLRRMNIHEATTRTASGFLARLLGLI